MSLSPTLASSSAAAAGFAPLVADEAGAAAGSGAPFARASAQAPVVSNRNKVIAQVALGVIGVIALFAAAVLAAQLIKGPVPYVGDTLSTLSQPALISATVGAGVLGIGCGIGIAALRGKFQKGLPSHVYVGNNNIHTGERSKAS